MQYRRMSTGASLYCDIPSPAGDCPRNLLSIRGYLLNHASVASRTPLATGSTTVEGKNMETKKTLAAIVLSLAALAAACSQPPKNPEEIGRFPVIDLEGVISRTDVEFDKEITSDGNGSLRITANAPVTVKLYETGDIHLEKAQLIYRARLRTEDVEGQVYLEMWCSFPGKGEFFSRALQSPLSGTNEWSSQETPFLLLKGENPDNVKMNLVVNGKGKVWIDDIRLLMSPLP